MSGNDRGRSTTSTAARMARSLADAVLRRTWIERACYLLAAVLICSGLFHLGVLLVTGGSWSGPVSWRKPATFGLSFGLTLATVTWVLSFASGRSRDRAVLLAVFAGACAAEVGMITVQAWRGMPSHFGVTGAGAGLLSAGAAGGGVALVATLATATVLVWRPDPGIPPSMRLALRVGFASLMVALALGVYMLARGMVLSRVGGDVDGAFAFTAGIKPGHAATMHGVLVLPFLAWMLSFAECPERSRLALVRLASSGYVLFAGIVVVEVLAGVRPLPVSAAPVVATVFALAGTALLIIAFGLALRALHRPNCAE
ncbi:hypothetical protein OU415_16590 [Saccharopolyspora sp. WRP15-2]|uniref:Uncharacterized protein n=1 Tax=Saccharopolyspora oryzae TaxID=2997343 RepID=A0ABT4UZC2_9PSEU|nr:hypothetical protein [Saccharopolyspora oryzae]MDA3627064.1 hypothetical protein [Saccharopolyspora oryzae]